MLRSSFNVCFRRIYCSQKSPIELHNFLMPKIRNRLQNVIPALQYATNTNSNKLKNPEKEKIYHGILSRQIRAVKVFSLSSSAVGVIVQPLIYNKLSELGGLPVIIAVYASVGFFTFVTPFLMHWVTKKYVTEIEYNHNTETYTATTLSFFLRKKKIDFKPEDVEVPDMLGMFTTFNIKGKPVFVEMKHFHDPTYYAKILGYDKPMDFKMGNINIPTEQSVKKTQ